MNLSGNEMKDDCIRPVGDLIYEILSAGKIKRMDVCLIFNNFLKK